MSVNFYKHHCDCYEVEPIDSSVEAVLEMEAAFLIVELVGEMRGVDQLVIESLREKLRRILARLNEWNPDRTHSRGFN